VAGFILESLSELRNLLVAAARGRFPTANLNRWSDFWKRLSIVALGMADLQRKLKDVRDSLDPLAAEGVWLTRIGIVWGVLRKGASPSAKSAALRVFGDSGATVSTGAPLTHLPSGDTYETRSGGTIPAAGYLDVDVAALSTGEQTNLEVDEELAFDTPPAGVKTNARIIVELEGGLDAELDGPLRERILNRIGEPSAGGNRNDWEQFLLEAATYVATGYVYPNRNGLGTVDLAALKSGTGTARLLDAGERTAVLTAIESLRPVTSTIRMLEVTTTQQDVEITVKPESDPAYTFDWNDSTPPTVSTWTAATRTLKFAAARPTDMAEGDRIVFDTAGQDGREYTIESLVSTDSVVLEEELAFTPVAADEVFSGGPVVADARQAIFDLFDAMGPANPDSKAYGPWEGNLRLSTLFEVVQTSEGVLDSQIVVPVANVAGDDPAWPNNDTVELLIPGKIIVRKDHS